MNEWLLILIWNTKGSPRIDEQRNDQATSEDTMCGRCCICHEERKVRGMIMTTMTKDSQFAGIGFEKHKIQEASPRVANRSSLCHEDFQVKTAAAILVEIFFFCSPAGSMTVAQAAPARPVFGSRSTCISNGLVPLDSCLPLQPSSLVACGGRRAMMCLSVVICRACHEVRLLIGWPAA